MKRIYYTGDLANSSGWFIATDIGGGNLRLDEEPGEFSEGRSFTIRANHVGNEYKGHCNPRFVTEAAHKAFYAEGLARLNAWRGVK